MIIQYTIIWDVRRQSKYYSRKYLYNNTSRSFAHLVLIDLLEFPDSESFIKQTFFVDSAANNSDRSKSATSFETFYQKVKIPTEYS